MLSLCPIIGSAHLTVFSLSGTLTDESRWIGQTDRWAIVWISRQLYPVRKRKSDRERLINSIFSVPFSLLSFDFLVFFVIIHYCCFSIDNSRYMLWLFVANMVKLNNLAFQYLHSTHGRSLLTQRSNTRLTSRIYSITGEFFGCHLIGSLPHSVLMLSFQYLVFHNGCQAFEMDQPFK